MIRKVKVPLKVKLNILITGLILFSIMLYVFFALDLFKKDKSAYVYETAFLNAENLSSQLSLELKNKTRLLSLLINTYNKNKKQTKDVFKSHLRLLSFSIYKEKKQLHFKLLNDQIFSSYNLSKSHLNLVKKINPLPFDLVKTKKIHIENPTISEGIPHFLMGIYKRGYYYFLRVSLEDYMAMFTRDKLYHSFSLTDTGELFIGTLKKGPGSKDYLEKIITGKLSQGVKELHLPDKSYLVAYVKIPQFNLHVISQIQQKEAFRAAEYLVEKSLYLSLFVLSIAIIAGIFFSKTQTAPIEKLFKATQNIAEGNFNSKVSIKSWDELGPLADSFNYMSKEIIRYTEEMKKKALLEKELSIAKLVQDSFFPEEDMRLPSLEISSFHTPASTCGGDWWGYVKHKEKTILIIADATGHGVPAAFMTATASCCAHTLQLIGDESILDSPSRILSFMNHAVSSVAEEIMMTCFVAIHDPTNTSLCYANASHNPPLLYTPGDISPTRKDFYPLLKAKGPRLGHKKDALYTEESITIQKNNTLVFYTDGITECMNKEGVQWGERRFLTSLAGHIHQDPSKMRDRLVRDIKDYGKGRSFADDITLVISRILS